MKNKNQQKDGVLKAVIYDDFLAVPYSVTFIGGQWWVTTPNEKLQPLSDFTDSEDIDFSFLCEAGGTVGALALAKMLGVALENPEDKVDEVLRLRVESLKRLGVMLDVKDEKLLLEATVFSNEGTHGRQGKYSIWCFAKNNCYIQLFDVDGFDTVKDVKEWVSLYCNALEKQGLEFSIIKEEKRV